jgi:hypothetical protein
MPARAWCAISGKGDFRYRHKAISNLILRSAPLRASRRMAASSCVASILRDAAAPLLRMRASLASYAAPAMSTNAPAHSVVVPANVRRDDEQAFCPTGKSSDRSVRLVSRVQSLPQKYFASPFGRNSFIDSVIPSHMRGASRSSRTLGAGCDGRKAPRAILARTNGVFADGEVVWS